MSGESPAPLNGPLAGLAPGARVAGYRLERLVGVGGMAVVFQALDERLNRVVALKLLAGDESLRIRFVREARAVAAVDHPHIIPVYEAGEADGLQYIAMRFVPGDTLQGVIRASGPLPPRRTAALISPVASALDAAHAAGLVHRDVKPGNILVDARRGGPEHPYLTDFGIARAMMSAGSLTVAGQFLGTPDYAAPEQINGQFVDGRADQYALACVAYEMLSGTVPFRRDSAWSVLYAHLNEPPPPIPARHGLPAAAYGVLLRALAKSPADRYATCGDFGDDLRESLGLDPYDPSRSVPGSGAGSAAGSVTSTLPITVAAPAPGPVTLDPAVPGSPNGTNRGNGAAPAGTWTAVVTADRAYYDGISVVDDKDTTSIVFPGDLPERRFSLAGPEIRIGRRSRSAGTDPEIDLGAPVRDPGVSAVHAKLIPASDGTWAVVDLGGTNGLTVNGQDVPPGDSVPLRPGDRIHLGAWTRITITRS
ncbi:MAG TPA: FHA domain-containing serine/threonine-protein kinase [Trebonia sp.]